jgi:DNA-binding response OmpR family regulator
VSAIPRSQTILLVEPDPRVAAELSALLGELGAIVWQAETGADARTILRDAQPDLIVLNLRLPDVDGLIVCAGLQTDAHGVPFLICSEGSTSEKVLAFKLGAEDFVARPFDAVELQARVEAILVRHARRALSLRSPDAVIPAPSGPDLGRLRVDLTRWRITLDDKPLVLTPTEFQLLVFMARRPGEIISREELAEGVWGNQSMSRSRTIDAYVRRIASKLTESQPLHDGDTPPRILNIRGLGYQLAVPRTDAA